MDEERRTLVLTGATGFIGSHIASYFTARNWLVIALCRNIPEHHLRGVLYCKCDLSSEEEIILPDKIAAFIHAAYIKQDENADAFRLNSKSAQGLLQKMQEKGVKQILFLSSLSANANALSVYGRQKAALEELFLQQHGTVIRAGLVLGNGGLFGSMRRYLKTQNRIPLFGNGKQPVQTVFIDDLVNAVYTATDKKLAGIFVVAGEEAVPYKQFYLELARSVGAEPQFVRVPFWLAGLLLKTAKLFGIKLPVTQENLLGLKQMKHIPSAEDLKKLNIELRDYKESFASIG